MGRNKTANKENEEPAALRGEKVVKSGTRAIWNTLTVQVLIATLLVEKAKGNQTDNAAWKADTWTACATALAGMESGENGSGGPVKTAKMCSTRWTSEKAEYLVFKNLRGLSGVGWDPETHTIVVSDEVWETYIKACCISHFLLLLLMAPSQAYLKAAKYRHKSYPLYDEMADLVDGGVATGDHSFVPGQPTVSQANQDDNNNFPLDPMLRGEGGVYRPDAQSQSQSDSQLSDSQDNPGTPISGWEKSDDDEPEEIQPPKNVKKRACAMSGSLSSASTGKRQHTDGHGRKPSAGHAMLAVSESLKAVATALGRDPGGPSSPQHKTQAIAIVMKMEIDQQDKIRALQLIRADTSVADVLLAIDENTEMCKGFLLAEIGAQTTL
ncbi:hypothetical protein C8R45DRAFT_1106431 [Mycena sanguinolenta]|nr:hypothetical protein C8R45DRAFT_1106431 [Mycena sanguinolenta]